MQSFLLGSPSEGTCSCLSLASKHDDERDKETPSKIWHNITKKQGNKIIREGWEGLRHKRGQPVISERKENTPGSVDLSVGRRQFNHPVQVFHQGPFDCVQRIKEGHKEKMSKKNSTRTTQSRVGDFQATNFIFDLLDLILQVDSDESMDVAFLSQDAFFEFRSSDAGIEVEALSSWACGRCWRISWWICSSLFSFCALSFRMDADVCAMVFCLDLAFRFRRLSFFSISFLISLLRSSKLLFSILIWKCEGRPWRPLAYGPRRFKRGCAGREVEPDSDASSIFSDASADAHLNLKHCQKQPHDSPLWESHLPSLRREWLIGECPNLTRADDRWVLLEPRFHSHLALAMMMSFAFVTFVDIYTVWCRCKEMLSSAICALYIELLQRAMMPLAMATPDSSHLLEDTDTCPRKRHTKFVCAQQRPLYCIHSSKQMPPPPKKKTPTWVEVAQATRPTSIPSTISRINKNQHILLRLDVCLVGVANPSLHHIVRVESRWWMLGRFRGTPDMSVLSRSRQKQSRDPCSLGQLRPVLLRQGSGGENGKNGVAGTGCTDSGIIAAAHFSLIVHTWRLQSPWLYCPGLDACGPKCLVTAISKNGLRTSNDLLALRQSTAKYQSTLTNRHS
ncbi:hypothetical protein VP01_214g2 [Puccinia sorghi]|uniref:Uncharacterized protein n=1 Tax=Puccinia sorghi TaxID=27349 RepID=A0A0L6V9T3_9BASI|nr:hypothetical protein VP01_214g2 [Puccinia sorghi]